MIVFKTIKHSEKTKTSIEKSLFKRLLDTKDFSFVLTPFSFFTKSFYSDLKQTISGLFIGTINNGVFELSRTSKIFSTRTWLPMKIKGIIKNNKVEIMYFIPNYILLIIAVLVLIDSFIISDTNKLDNVLFFISGLIPLMYFIKIIRTEFIFKKLITKE